MEEPSEEEIAKVYELRRLSQLRDLAIRANQLIEARGEILIDDLPVLNPTIINVEERDADYLWFALWNRVQAEILDMKIPEELGYGFAYDRSFKLYATKDTLITKKRGVKRGHRIVEDWLPYAMMKNSDKLYLVYIHIITSLDKKYTIEILTQLMNGSPRDIILQNFLNAMSDTNIKNIFLITLRNILNMVINEEFDVLDSIFIITYATIHRDVYQNYLSDTIHAFMDYID